MSDATLKDLIGLLGALSTPIVAALAERLKSSKSSSFPSKGQPSPKTGNISRFWVIIGVGFSLTALSLFFFEFWMREHPWTRLDTIPSNNEWRVGRLSGGSFVRIEGYTTENEFSHPFVIYLSRAYDEKDERNKDQDSWIPIITETKLDNTNFTKATVRGRTAAAANVEWKSDATGVISIKNGNPSIRIGLIIKRPLVYKGSFDKIPPGE